MTIATCAACGKQKELCGSARIDGVQQPRICKECLVESMTTGDSSINDLYWLAQMLEMGDTDSLKAIQAKVAGRDEGGE